jgi:outer membrane protein assembly factor BamA
VARGQHNDNANVTWRPRRATPQGGRLDGRARGDAPGASCLAGAARRLGASRLAGAALLLFAAVGCGATRQPPACTRPDLGGCAVDELSFEGNRVVSGGELAERIATAESEHLLSGLLEHVPVLRVLDALSVEYERFDRSVLDRDLARIHRYYRSRGFYDARVRAARVQRIGGSGPSGRVRVHLVISEGEPVRVASVDLRWKDWSLEKAGNVTRPVTDARNQIKVGVRFEEEPYEATKKALLRALTDRGFAYATVEGHVDVDVVSREARVSYTIELGPQTRFGKITLAGLGDLPEGPLRAALGIKEGDRFSTQRLADAERALADFGVFGAIEVKPELAAPGEPREPRVPVTFAVQPVPLRAVRLGGGAEIGVRVEGHLVAGWEDRNFLGGLRRFSVEARPGLILYPTRISTLFDAPPTHVLPQLRLQFELRQPATFEGRTTGLLSGAYKLYSPSTFDTAPGEPILGYREYTGAIGLQRPFLRSALNASLLYNVQLNSPFSYNDVALKTAYDLVFIPSVQALVSYDLRRNLAGRPDRLNPRKGVYLAADTQLAGYPAGSARDVRIQPELRAYVPISRRLTLGFRLLTGFLFPLGDSYGCAFEAREAGANAEDAGAACGTSLARDLQLLQFRGFFSGGATSNRGYGFNEVGPQDYLTNLAGVQSEGLVPTGGLSLWESSLELRMPILGDLGTAVFLDGSDVARRRGSFRLSRPHLSAGLGLRYETPVGPLRVDVGYRLPCAQVLGICPGEPLPEGERAPDTLLGLPMAVNIAIGQAF